MLKEYLAKFYDLKGHFWVKHLFTKIFTWTTFVSKPVLIRKKNHLFEFENDEFFCLFYSFM